MKTFIIFSTIFLTLCCTKTQKKAKKTLTDFTIQIDEKEIYAKKIIECLNRVRFSDNLEPNGGIDFEVNDSSYFIEVLEEMVSKEKIIDHTQSFYKNSNRHNKTYSFFIDNYSMIKLVIITNSIYLKEKKTHEESKDSIFFKKNKLYFWKNKNPSKEEILSKEKEILAIKREIDSILDN